MEENCRVVDVGMAEKSSSFRQEKRFSFADVIFNAVEPGVNRSVLLFVNAVFLILLLIIVLIIQFSTGYKLYMIILITLAFGLFIAFNW